MTSIPNHIGVWHHSCRTVVLTGFHFPIASPSPNILTWSMRPYQGEGLKFFFDPSSPPRTHHNWTNYPEIPLRKKSAKKSAIFGQKTLILALFDPFFRKIFGNFPLGGVPPKRTKSAKTFLKGSLIMCTLEHCQRQLLSFD